MPSPHPSLDQHTVVRECLTTLATQPAAPLEYLPGHASLLGHDLVSPLAVAVLFTYVTITIWRGAQDVDRPAAGGVLLAAAAPLHDLGPLVLGDHALDLDQQVRRGVIA